jgi:uncharacterized protein (TIGR01589 family)
MKAFSSEPSAVSSYHEYPQQQHYQQYHHHHHNANVVSMQQQRPPQMQLQQQPTASQLMSKNRRDLRKRKQMARKFGTREIVIVQSLIERCLMFYATKEEVIEILEKKCGIDEVITSVIWDKLEQQNEEFFKEYHQRLKMKERIEAFNEEICNYAQTIGIIPSEVEEEEDGRNTMSNDENGNANNKSEDGSDNACERNKPKKKKTKKSKTTKEATTNAVKKDVGEKNKNNRTSNKRTGTGALSGAVSATLTPLALAPGELRNLNDNPEADLPSMELSFEEEEEEKDEIPLPQEAPSVVGEKATA